MQNSKTILSENRDLISLPYGAGEADRKHCRFKPDPGVPELFTAHNEDYLRSGWSRGHMAPAGDNKISEVLLNLINS